MTTHSAHLRLSTQGDGAVTALSDRIAAIVRESGAERGVASVFVAGGTAAITTMEYEPGGVQELSEPFERLVPRDGDHAAGGSAPGGPPAAGMEIGPNPRAVALGAIVGPSESIPIDAGRLLLGTWQEIVLVDFDDRPRERTVIVTVVC